MNSAEVAIIDYGLGNLFNVTRALEFLNAPSVITKDKDVIQDARRIILPGVGAFGEGIKNLQELGLIPVIQSFVASGRPVLGVCLGMQLLMTESEEHGLHKGLDLVKGRVVRFAASDTNDEQFKIPHIGWNTLQSSKAENSPKSWAGTLLDGTGSEPYMYFVHSYTVAPEDPAHCLAMTSYGKDYFCSVLKKGNVTGCQFHPERSGETGLKILKNFIAAT